MPVVASVAMRLCLMIEGQEDVTWPQWIALAETCERVGLEGLFRSDHYISVDEGSTRGSLDAWTTLAGLAARTERIRLGTMVSPATFRHPSVLGRAATTVDHISGGRVELGLGAGWYEREHRAFGFPFPPLGERMEVFEEQAEVIVGQWTTESFSYAGRHYRLEDCDALPRPVQRPHPPLIIGGSGKRRTVEVAARLGQEYNVVGPTVTECRALRTRMDEACARHGRDPSSLVLSAMCMVVVGVDAAEAEARAQRLVDLGFEQGDGASVLAENRGTWVCGTVAEAVTRLRELADAGVERMMLQHLLHDDLDAVELFGRELVPAVS
jgi:F420-dependent oxidoreductase-like protein